MNNYKESKTSFLVGPRHKQINLTKKGYKEYREGKIELKTIERLQAYFQPRMEYKKADMLHSKYKGYEFRNRDVIEDLEIKRIYRKKILPKEQVFISNSVEQMRVQAQMQMSKNPCFNCPYKTRNNSNGLLDLQRFGCMHAVGLFGQKND